MQLERGVSQVLIHREADFYARLGARARLAHYLGRCGGEYPRLYRAKAVA